MEGGIVIAAVLYEHQVLQFLKIAIVRFYAS